MHGFICFLILEILWFTCSYNVQYNRVREMAVRSACCSCRGLEFSSVMANFVNRLHLESTKTQVAGHFCESVFKNQIIWSRKPHLKSGPHFLMAAQIKWHARRKLCLFARLPHSVCHPSCCSGIPSLFRILTETENHLLSRNPPGLQSQARTAELPGLVDWVAASLDLGLSIVRLPLLNYPDHIL